MALCSCNSKGISKSFKTRKISFDAVVQTMYRTGRDMDEKYRETAHGGLAQLYAGFVPEEGKS